MDNFLADSTYGHSRRYICGVGPEDGLQYAALCFYLLCAEKGANLGRSYYMCLTTTRITRGRINSFMVRPLVLATWIPLTTKLVGNR